MSCENVGGFIKATTFDSERAIHPDIGTVVKMLELSDKVNIEQSTSDDTGHTKVMDTMEGCKQDQSSELVPNSDFDTDFTVVIGDDDGDDGDDGDDDDMVLKVDCDVDTNNAVELEDGFLWVSSTINEGATNRLQTSHPHNEVISEATNTTLATCPPDQTVIEGYTYNVDGTEENLPTVSDGASIIQTSDSQNRVASEDDGTTALTSSSLDRPVVEGCIIDKGESEHSVSTAKEGTTNLLQSPPQNKPASAGGAKTHQAPCSPDWTVTNEYMHDKANNEESLSTASTTKQLPTTRAQNRVVSEDVANIPSTAHTIETNKEPCERSECEESVSTINEDDPSKLRQKGVGCGVKERDVANIKTSHSNHFCFRDNQNERQNCLSQPDFNSLKLNMKPVSSKRKSDGQFSHIYNTQRSHQASKSPFENCKVFKVVNIDIPKFNYFLKPPKGFRGVEEVSKVEENNNNITVVPNCVSPPREFSDTNPDVRLNKTTTSDVMSTGRKMETDLDIGLILEPPPGFNSEAVAMETDVEPTTVWDPGTSFPTNGDTLATGPTLPIPPPPAAVDDTTDKRVTGATVESDADTVKHKHNADNVTRNGFPLLRLRCEDFRRNSAEADLSRRKENSELSLDVNQNVFRKSDSNILCPAKNITSRTPGLTIGHSGGISNKENVCAVSDTQVTNTDNLDSKIGNMDIAHGIKMATGAENVLDLLDSYHQQRDQSEHVVTPEGIDGVNSVPTEPKNKVPRYIAVGKNPAVVDESSASGRPAVRHTDTSDKCAADHSSSITSVNDNNNNIENTKSKPSIPTKPKSLSPNLQKSDILTNKEMLKTLQNDDSPEMQVMFNSLSPVLLRRRPSQRSTGRKTAESSSNESSPEMPKKGKVNTPQNDHNGSVGNDLPLTEEKLNDTNEAKNKMHEENKNKSESLTNIDTNITETQDIKGESLFMNPEMAKTWHGATSANWSQIYGPQMRAMIRGLNGMANDNADSDMSSNYMMDEKFESGSKTLPSRSLLDQMHKKFCADQYLDNQNSDIAKALVLLKLKPNSHNTHLKVPGQAKRSQSFNIRMGTGTSNPASSERSPLLSQKRILIKTCSKPIYPARFNKAEREVTPDDLHTQPEAQNSRKEEAEIEAAEACRWLKETGFPQYAQMYEDGQFPLDVDSVENDHDFLDKEDIQSLFRRLNSLNKCAMMKIGTPSRKDAEDSDDEDQCALSDKWKYTRSSRRWSRKDLDCPAVLIGPNGIPVLRSSSSHDSLLAGQNSSSEFGDSPVLNSKMHHLNNDEILLQKTSTPSDPNGNAGFSPNVLRRAASERIKGAKSFLKRMETLKGKRSRKQKHIGDISSPVLADKADMQAKIKHLNCKDLNSNERSDSDQVFSPAMVTSEAETSCSDISSNVSHITSPGSESLRVTSPGNDPLRVTSPGSESIRGTSPGNRLRVSSLDQSADSSINHSTRSEISDSDQNMSSLTNGALGLSADSQSTCSSGDDTLFLPVDYRPGKFPKLLDDSMFTACDNMRTRSFSYVDDSSDQTSNTLRRGSHDPRQRHRVSIYDNVPIEEDLTVAQQELDIILSELFQNINGLNRAINGDDAELLEPPVAGLFDDTSLGSQTPENEPSLDTTSDILRDPNTDTTSDILRDHDENENEVVSGTMSSPDISDHELHTDLSPDDSTDHVEYRDRRDSGVGSSLTRASSGRRRYRIRWHSFQKSHRPNSDNRTQQICSLSAGQILVLRKLSLLRLTALVEKYSPNRSGWALTMPRFMKRNKVPDYRDKNVFGVPLSVMIQRTGQALPQCVLYAMRFLRRNASDAVGIFRKPGVRSRIQRLRNEIEANPDIVDFEELQAYDVADLVKLYFRELPECLLTNKLSDTFLSIFIYVPVELRVEALQSAVVLMADENRDVLQSLLLFLSDISQHVSQHQMTASNLAVCFAPSLFNMGGLKNPTQTPSPRRNRKNMGIPDARELMEQKAAHECLTIMIQEVKNIFTIAAGTLSKCRCWHGDTVTLSELGDGTGEEGRGYRAYVESCVQGLLKEQRDKFRGWVTVPGGGAAVELAYKKVGDGHPLRLWKCTVEVEAPPADVLSRVLHERQKWDEDLLSWSCLEKLDEQTEVFQFLVSSMPPHPPRDYCVLRAWRTNLPRGAAAVISTSIDHPRAEAQGDVHAVELASRFLIEPCGTGRSRLTHISRVDMRGHSPDWYKKVYGHICVNFVARIRATFSNAADGQESKV